MTRQLWTLLLFLCALAARCDGAEADTAIHGTLISAFGNGKGLVVVTDSMGTLRDASGQVNHQSPFQKLLKYDDHTVCAIAGALILNVPDAPNHNHDEESPKGAPPETRAGAEENLGREAQAEVTHKTPGGAPLGTNVNQHGTGGKGFGDKANGLVASNFVALRSTLLLFVFLGVIFLLAIVFSLSVIAEAGLCLPFLPSSTAFNVPTL